jgi:hypothetical protein
MRTWVTPGTTVEVLLQKTRKASTRVSLQYCFAVDREI